MATEEMYKQAFAYKQTKLWKDMFDSELFAVRLSDGEIGYCCVMGLGGEHIALAVYVGDEGFQSFRELAFRERLDFEDLDFDPLNAMSWAFRQVCLQCSFENREDLEDWEVAEVRQYAKFHKIQLRGAHSFPKFSQYLRYRMPWDIRKPEDRRRVCEALAAATALAELLRTKSKEEIGLLPVDEDTETLPLLIPGEGGYTVSSTSVPEPWEESWAPLPEMDEESVTELRKLRKRGVYACETLRLPGIIGGEDDDKGFLDDEDDKDGDEAPAFPALLICVNAKSGEFIGASPSMDYDARPESLRDAFAQTLLRNGECPRAVKVRDEQTRVLLEDLCMKVGVLLSVDSDLPALDEARERILSMIQDEDGLFDDEDDEDDEDTDGMDMEEAISFAMDEMMRMTDQELKSLPREMVREILNMAPFGFVPQELQLRLRRLFKP